MPIYLIKAKRQVTIFEVAELDIEADSEEQARAQADALLLNANWREDHTSGYSVEDPIVEILANGDEKLPEEIK